MKPNISKSYKAKKEGLIKYLISGFLILPILIFFLDKDTFSTSPFIMFPLLTPLIVLIWIYVDTSYKIEKNKLFYRSGFLRGQIDIEKIKEITKGKTLWSGLKPALAKNGLIIKYNRFDEIYIAPENNEEIIADLLAVNSKIQICEQGKGISSKSL